MEEEEQNQRVVVRTSGKRQRGFTKEEADIKSYIHRIKKIKQNGRNVS